MEFRRILFRSSPCLQSAAGQSHQLRKALHIMRYGHPVPRIAPGGFKCEPCPHRLEQISHGCHLGGSVSTQKKVLVLGAGASKPYGYPLGAELRELILQLTMGTASVTGVVDGNTDRKSTRLNSSH